ncbi:hypothetical protein ACWGJT_20445 [Streptomyces xantholiticus]
MPAMTWSVDGQQLKSGGKCADVVGGSTANGAEVADPRPAPAARGADGGGRARVHT